MAHRRLRKAVGDTLNARPANHALHLTAGLALSSTMGIVDGRSKPGDYVELRAESRVLAVVSNCPQTHNPCNGFNPTPGCW